MTTALNAIALQFSHQFFKGYPSLLENGLKSFGGHLTMHRHTGVMRSFYVMAMRTSLAPKHKSKAYQGATQFFTRNIPGKFHVAIATTGSFRKCKRIAEVTRLSPGSKRQLTRSRIIGIRPSSDSACVAISGSWQTATNQSPSCSTSKNNSFMTMDDMHFGPGW